MARPLILNDSTCGGTERMPGEQEPSMAPLQDQDRPVATIATRLFG